LHQKGGTSGADIWNSADSYMRFATNDTERMRIDASGNVGIGVVPESYQELYRALQVGNTALIGRHSGGTSEMYLTANSYYDGAWKYIVSDEASVISQSAGVISFLNAASGTADATISWSEAMRIDSSGNLLHGITGVPTGVLLGKQLVSSSPTGSEIIAFREDSSVAVGDKCGAFLIGNSDTDGNEDHFVGMWGKTTSTNGAQNLNFAAGRSGYESDSPQMTLDSSGNLLVGKTGTSFSTAGSRLTPDGGGQFVVDGAAGVEINRLTSDGDIVAFYKDTTTKVGSIGSSNGGERLYMVNDSTGFCFLGDFSRILPCDSAGAPRDAAIDLGQSSGGRFRDLYLSGGVQFGTTGAAAQNLDDYEEGTWTPTLLASTTNPTTSSLTIHGATYTKVGRTVHVQAYIVANITNVGSGDAQIGGLPFNVATGYTPAVFKHGDLIESNGGYFNNGSNNIIAINDYTTNGKPYAGTGNRGLMISGTYEVS